MHWTPDGDDLVVKGNNLEFLRTLPDASFRLIYVDPPFNAGKVQTRQTMKTMRSASGSRAGFKGQTYGKHSVNPFRVVRAGCL